MGVREWMRSVECKKLRRNTFRFTNDIRIAIHVDMSGNIIRTENFDPIRKNHDITGPFFNEFRENNSGEEGKNADTPGESAIRKNDITTRAGELESIDFIENERF